MRLYLLSARMWLAGILVGLTFWALHEEVSVVLRAACVSIALLCTVLSAHDLATQRHSEGGGTDG